MIPLSVLEMYSVASDSEIVSNILTCPVEAPRTCELSLYDYYCRAITQSMV